MIESVLYIGDPDSFNDPIYCVTLDLNRLSITKDQHGNKVGFQLQWKELYHSF